MRIKLSNSKGQIKTFEVEENMTIEKAKEITNSLFAKKLPNKSEFEK